MIFEKNHISVNIKLAYIGQYMNFNIDRYMVTYSDCNNLPYIDICREGSRSNNESTPKIGNVHFRALNSIKPTKVVRSQDILRLTSKRPLSMGTIVNLAPKLSI